MDKQTNYPPSESNNGEFLNIKNPRVRGKDITSYGIEKIHELINTKDMPGLYLGDYFDLSINSGNWNVQLMIVDYNTVFCRKRSAASSVLSTPHIALMTKNPLPKKYKMNTTATTNGGFAGSYMAKTVLPDLELQFNKSLNNHLMTFDDWQSTNIDGNGSVSAQSRLLTLPTEEMITGVCKMSYAPHDCYAFPNQLALFMLFKNNFFNTIVNGIDYYWLQNIGSSTEFAAYCDYGGCNLIKANQERYIKPIMFMC